MAAALSRTPSPAPAGSDSDSVMATPLTPRAKLRALFATIDGNESSSSSEREDGGDNKENQGTPSSRKNKNKTKKTTKTHSTPSKRVSPLRGRASPLPGTATTPVIERSGSHDTSDSESNNGNGDDDDDDDDLPVRPRGRLAARMQAGQPTARAERDEEAAPLAGNARERVKRMLEQQAEAEKQAEKPSTEHDHENDAEDEDEDEEDVPPVATRPRKLLSRVAHRSSASPQRSPSPGMFMTPTKPAQAAAQGEDDGGPPDMFVTPSKGGAAGTAAASSPASKPGGNARFQALVARKREEARAREEEEERKRAARWVTVNDDDGEDEDDRIMAADDDDEVSDISDDAGGRKLTQDVARPSRKASKKALEEMHRETQRMARNLQLAHEAKTRKKISKSSLFERFNFKPEGVAVPEAEAPSSSSRPASPVSSPRNNHTDTEMHGSGVDTPPSSPPVPLASQAVSPSKKQSATEQTGAATTTLDKGKGKAVVVVDDHEEVKPKRQVRLRMPVQTNLVMIDSDDEMELEIVQTTKNKLDIMFDNAPLKREKEPRSIMVQRRLAQLGSPSKNKNNARMQTTATRNNLSLGELEQMLQERARRQAKIEREQHMEMLRAKGITIQTEEEREKEMAEVEDIVARARREAEEIMQRERDDAEKEKKANGEDNGSEKDVLDWDDSDDDEGEYEPEEEQEEEREIQLSGSEDGDMEDDDSDKEKMDGMLIDDDAESADESEDGEPEEQKGEDVAEDAVEAENKPAVEPTPTRARKTRRRVALMISDDEDEEESSNTATPLAGAKTPGPKTMFAKSPNVNTDSPQVPTSVLRSATKTFIPGLPVAVGGPAGLGLTQIFAGTLADDSQTGSLGGFGSPTQLMPTIGNFVDGDFSQMGGGKATASGAEQDLVMDSQPTQEWIKRMQSGSNDSQSQAVLLDYSQSQMHGLGSLLGGADASQASVMMDSQDMGPQDYTPLKSRFVEHQPSTLDTVILDPSQVSSTEPESSHQTNLASQSPVAAVPPRRKGLYRKSDISMIEEEDEDAEDEAEEEDEKEAATAFSKLQEAAALEKKKRYDRKKSKAKDMVEDQAEESEDEYAGLGGADGEDSDDESLASVEDMIDDRHKMTEAENARLAAFNADRERADDEKQVEKLFRDVTTGALRKKRGADYGDLSDSDDGGEARRRLKRRKFAAMQKALFADERVSKVAENPKNQAFLRTIEDRGSDDEMDFLFEAEAPAASASKASEASSATAIPDSQPMAGAALAPAVATATNPRRQRSHTGKKPSNIGEIRETLSLILDEDDGTNLSVVADTEFGSDDEAGHDNAGGSEEDHRREDMASSNKENQQPRLRHTRNNLHIVDRISLKRSASHTPAGMPAAGAAPGGAAAGASGAGGRSAFETGPNGGFMGPTGFRVPALLRRATTNSLISTSSTDSSSRRSSVSSAASSNNSSSSHFADQGKIRKNASKMSGINYFARENERRAAVAESEKRRQAKKVRSAEGRSRAMGGLFAAGKFE